MFTDGPKLLIQFQDCAQKNAKKIYGIGLQFMPRVPSHAVLRLAFYVVIFSFSDDFHFADDHQFLDEFHPVLRFQSELQEKGQLCLHSNLRQIKEKEVI